MSTHLINPQPQILRVALDVPLDRVFDYLNNGFHVKFGTRVVVPFAGRQLVGIVLEQMCH
jgi:primosomal protein N' (replication factor Y) (superfamily II helicase)